MIDYSKLRGRIKEMNYSEKEFANMIGMSASTFCGKIKGITFFNTDEIKKSIKLLNIPKEDIFIYFFKEKTE